MRKSKLLNLMVGGIRLFLNELHRIHIFSLTDIFAGQIDSEMKINLFPGVPLQPDMD